ncbi:MAG: biotin carboxylase N-terminal domain-containing protein [Burkholderiaceae bacterium]
MFDALLIANRGEIACRVIRTCRRIGIRTIAVFSDADANARHVREADAAIRIGPAPARASYLDAHVILQAAIDSGAQAIHPGYGFLSEKLELIDACAATGITFIGPHRDAIALMGSKIESKRIARAAGVPCVPGYDGDDQTDARLHDEAQRIGFPLLIKASAGGGGKGMKRVDDAAAFAARLHAARGEALASFADDRVLLERYIQRPRHLEVQLLGDRHGGLVHLFERECSIQRNYQKLIEEAPANHLGDAIRTKLFDAALMLGRAIGYDSTGTVEFVLDADAGDTPCFLEMNTRLQVEHPVTEMTVTADGMSIDLVEQQILSALGERLVFAQPDIRRHGWAIEARINAEVPEQDFGASFGPITGYEEPVVHGLRFDSGIDARSTITPHYDAMLAKVIASAATRAVARDRLLDGLRRLRIEGIQTNQRLLAAVVASPAFDAVLTTRFLPDAFPDGYRVAAMAVDERVCAAAAARYFAAVERHSSDRPLAALTGFRLTAPAGRRAMATFLVSDDAADRIVVVESLTALRVACHLDGDTWPFDGETGAVVSATRRYRASIDDAQVALWTEGTWKRFAVGPAVAARQADDRTGGGGDCIAADLPGVVTQVLVDVDQPVAAGTPVIVVEAMKLFHTLVAPRDGVIAHIRVAIGATVDRGDVLVELAPATV